MDTAKNANYNRSEVISLLLAPSVTSSVITAIMTLGLFGWLFQLVVSQRELLNMFYPNTTSLALPEIYRVSYAVNNSEFFGSLAVFVMWFIVGMLGYLLIEGIRLSVMSGFEFEQEIEHAAPTARLTLLRLGAWQMLARLFGVSLLYIAYVIIVLITPHLVVFLRHTSSSDGTRLIALFCVTLIVSFTAVHLVTVGLRLMLFRMRVVSWAGWA